MDRYRTGGETQCYGHLVIIRDEQSYKLDLCARDDVTGE